MSDFWVISSYFNPAKYKNKKENYLRFRENLLLQGANLITMEQVLDLPELSEFPEVISVSGGSILWQKERILNLAIRKLPETCKFVAWLDSDIIFEKRDWILESKLALESCPILQPFSKVYRLPKGILEPKEAGDVWESFCFKYRKNPCIFLNGDFDLHGHSGFAWVARKEVVDGIGLYDACIMGSSDHMMAHAFAGDWESPCVVRILGRYGKFLGHFQKWANLIYQRIRGRLGYVSGSIFHLWHGDVENRKYVSRNKKLLEFRFDPEMDIIVGKNGLWNWNSEKTDMHEWCKNYFALRKEDLECLNG